MITTRIQKLRQKLAGLGTDGILISEPKNRYYLSGFSGSDGYLAIAPRNQVLATDFRYVEQADREAPEYAVFRIAGPLADWLPRLVALLEVKTLGFESEHVSYAFHQQINDVLSKTEVKLTPTTGVMESMRMVKEPGEVELISRAAAITDAAFEHVRGKMKVGMSELEAAWEVEKFMRENGSQPLPFDVIVASGPNSALPHARPSTRTIGTGEPVVVDIGAHFGGYTSDMTRTFCLGERDNVFNKVYGIVLEAQQAAIKGIRENMTGEEADRLARSVIEQAGYGSSFGHGTGHGVGLETHELPRISQRSPDKLMNGMVFTVEPGVYITGWGGIRIEDDVVLESGAARVLSRTPK